MQRISVEFAIDGDRCDAEISTRSNDSDSDLAAVCNQYLAEHRNSLPEVTGETERCNQEAASDQLAGTRFSSIRWVAETGSTNDDLAAIAKDGADEHVLVTDLQTAGRGRRNRVWDAPPESAVLMSILLRDGRSTAPSRRPFWAVGAVALAAAEAAGQHSDTSPMLKWPNDVLIGEAKLAGVLSQVVDDGIIVGIGINVNWDAATVARFAELERPATAINQHLGPQGSVIDRVALVVDLLRRLEILLSVSPDELEKRWIQRCTTIGSTVRVERADGNVVGDAVGVRSDGALLVSADGETTAHVLGDVTHLRRL